MTVTADHVSPPLGNSKVDQRPGSTDVTWAERAYHNEPRKSAAANERRQYTKPTGAGGEFSPQLQLSA